VKKITSQGLWNIFLSTTRSEPHPKAEERFTFGASRAHPVDGTVAIPLSFPMTRTSTPHHLFMGGPVR
jgi:hypothetical protein